MKLGPISHRPGTSAGIPQHLRAGVRSVISTSFTGAADINSAGAYTIEGKARHPWTVGGTASSTMATTADGLHIVSDGGAIAELSAPIPGVAAGDWLCVGVVLEVISLSASNSQTVNVKLTQDDAGGSDLEYDIQLQVRKQSAGWRPRIGYRGSSSYSMSYSSGVTNPWISTGTGLPDRIQIWLFGCGYSWQWAMSSESAVLPVRGVTGSDGAAGTIRSRGAGNAGGGDAPPLMDRLRIGIYPAGGSAEMKIRSCQVWLGAKHG